MIATENHTISPQHPLYWIAEIGLNHNGSLDLAKRMVDAAAESGASAAKFQLFHPDHFLDGESRIPLEGNPTLREFFGQFCLREEEWVSLAEHTRSRGLDFLCSIFDRPSLDLYWKLSPSAVKIASGDITNRILLEDLSATGIPLMISTGTADRLEVESALGWIPQEVPRLLFQCVAAYPASPADFHLRVIPHWRELFQCSIGISDHSSGRSVTLAAIALGVDAVERHFTLDRGMEGPDQALSVEPHFFREMVEEGAEIRSALGVKEKSMQAAEEGVKRGARRSLAVSRDLPGGHTISREDLLPLRPGSGIPVERYREVLGGTLNRDYREGEFLDLTLLNG